jgi:hypothetical protein
MNEMIKYIKKGMKQAILVGKPDFNINNQYIDIENISEDFQYSRSIIIDEISKKSSQKSTKYSKRK